MVGVQRIRSHIPSDQRYRKGNNGEPKTRTNAMNLNQATIVGRMVKDPEVKSLPSGAAVAGFSVATSRVWKGSDGKKNEDTEFHNCVAFGKTAEIIGQYVKKGQLILITGRIQTRSWEKDGRKNYRTEIVVEQMQMGPKPAGSSGPKKEDAKDKEFNNYGKKDSVEYPEEEINADDIPF